MSFVEPNIEDLPDEVIVIIFSYLSLPDRKSARLVNRKWCNLSYSASLTKNDIHTIKSVSQLKNVSLNRKIFNIKIKNIKDDSLQEIPKYWIKCAENVKSVEFYLVDLNDSFPWKLLEYTPNLEYLLMSSYDENDQREMKSAVKNNDDIEPCFDTNIISLPKLLSIDLLHFPNLSGALFSKLISTTPKLKRLSMEWFLSDYKNLFDSIKKFIESHGKSLKELIFSRSGITDAFLISILPNLGTNLTGLYLKQCKDLNGQFISHIAKHVPNLKEIDLSISMYCDTILYDLFKELKHLTHIALLRTSVGPLTIPVLSDLPNLKALELSHSYGVTTQSLEQLFSVSTFNKLIDLRLDRLKVSNELLQVMLPKVTFLNYLYLNDCVRLNNDSLQLICKFCVRLRSLSLQNCIKIDDVSCVNSLKGLIHLDLYGLRRVTSLTLSQLKLLELQTLDVSRTGVCKETLQSLNVNCPTLQDVYFDFEWKYDFRSEPVKYKMHFGFTRFRGDPIFDN